MSVSECHPPIFERPTPAFSDRCLSIDSSKAPFSASAFGSRAFSIGVENRSSRSAIVNSPIGMRRAPLDTARLPAALCVKSIFQTEQNNYLRRIDPDPDRALSGIETAGMSGGQLLRHRMCSEFEPRRSARAPLCYQRRPYNMLSIEVRLVHSHLV